MTKRFNPPSAHRASAVAIAAALAAFAGVAGAQSARPAQPAVQPGYVVSSQGTIVRSTYDDCVQSGQSTVKPGTPCPGPATVRTAAADSPRAGSADSPRAGMAAPAAAAASGATAAPSALPGYAQSSNGQVVLSGFGTCVRAGHWAPQHAAEPCDRMAVAQVEPPPAPVAAAPEPKLEPAPAAAAPAPAPAPLAAPEPPRPVIQRITLSSDVLFEFDKAALRDTGKQKLDEIVSATKDARVEEVLAIGYADPIGSDQYNEKLSAARAQAVREYLVQNGVSPERIKSEGRGETREFSAGSCAKLTGKKLIDCFEPNRRVDVELLGSREVAAGSPAAGTGATGTTPGGSAGASGATGTR
jgi:OOP family OmpA-OmpF porin